MGRLQKKTADPERTRIAQINATVEVYWYVAGPYSTMKFAQEALEEVAYDPPKWHGHPPQRDENYVVVSTGQLQLISEPPEPRLFPTPPWLQQTQVEAHRVKGFPSELNTHQAYMAWFTGVEDEDSTAKPNFSIRRPKKMLSP